MFDFSPRYQHLGYLVALVPMLPGCSFGYEMLTEESLVLASGGMATGGSGSAGATAGSGTLASCGDGLVNPQAGEACDDGAETATCNADCSSSTCGDDKLNVSSGEECEPGLEANCGGDCRYTRLHYLVHRYSFDGTGTTLVDSVGGANGTVVGTTLPGTGQLVLSGLGSGQYGDLPNGIISALTNATFEIWLSWSGGNQWQRVFEFGSSVGGEDVVDAGLTYLVVVPRATDGYDNWLRLALSNTGSPAPFEIDAPSILPSTPGTHLVVVVDDDNDEMRLYVDGALAGQGALGLSLSDLNDVNNWLGKSQWTGDPEFGGSFDEFRIYDKVLSDQEITDSLAAGPDI